MHLPTERTDGQAWALMEAKRGDAEAAISLFKKAILKRPRDGAVWQAYALLLKVRL